jgi:hypothetical protein
MSGVTSITVNTESAAAEAAAASTPATPAVERPEYIPEKFWRGNVEESAKAMAQSYVELERKQSGGKPEGTGATAEATPPTAPTTPSTPEAPAAPAAVATEVTQAVESALTSAAGSAADLTATLEWARVNASAEHKALFDSALDTGNAQLAALAFGQIKQAYTEAMGSQGTRVSGEGVPATSGVKPFASQQEIIEFVNSKAYKAGDKRAHAEYDARMRVTNW